MRWADGLDTNDEPTAWKVCAARLLWEIVPARFAGDRDATRLLTLSWIRMNLKANENRPKDAGELIDGLLQEGQAVGRYAMRHRSTLSAGRAAELGATMLAFLNRARLFEASGLAAASTPALPALPGDATLDQQELWFREAMIDARLAGNAPKWRDYRARYADVLRRRDSQIPQAFREGMVEFYDTVLACVQGELESAKGTAAKARQSMAVLPAGRTRFFGMDLNMLLVGAAMREQTVCKPLLSSMILDGPMP